MWLSHCSKGLQSYKRVALTRYRFSNCEFGEAAMIFRRAFWCLKDDLGLRVTESIADVLLFTQQTSWRWTEQHLSGVLWWFATGYVGLFAAPLQSCTDIEIVLVCVPFSVMRRQCDTLEALQGRAVCLCMREVFMPGGSSWEERCDWHVCVSIPK